MSDTSTSETSAAATSTGPTRLSHPGSNQIIEVVGDVSNYLANGWRPATPEAPKASASLGAWQKFARSQGITDADIDGKTKAELRSALS